MKSFKLPLVAVFMGATIMFFSCSKSNNSKSSGNAEFKYTVSGKTYDVSGQLAGNPTNPTYGINALEAIITGPPSDTLFYITSLTDQQNFGALSIHVGEITAKTYSPDDCLLEIAINGKDYAGGSIYTQDLSVTVTSVHDGLVDGTFSGTVDTGNSDAVSVTNGEFHNIKFSTVTE
ncbi:MAG TPA: hypothetical protein VG890_07910 [Puia sp.]|nr:hypothetical protein [Puia sp.]